MFAKAGAFFGHSLHTVSNPYECNIEGIKFLGTSGQNIESIRQFSSIDDSIKLMEYTLECGHLAPTAPDSLGCFPYYETDPFIIPQHDGPHVYFAGNQPNYSCKTIESQSGKSVAMISVPSFHSTLTAALVNLRDLSCQPVTFSVSIANQSDSWNTNLQLSSN